MSDLRAVNVIDSFTMTVSNTGVGLDSATPPLVNGLMSGHMVRKAIISVNTNSIRWRADGTAPTDTVGHLIEAGGFLSLTGANYRSMLAQIQFIRVTNDATIFGTALD
jgi:hypothetical protein